MTTSLRIAEVADRVGISTATVRYYERIGVLPVPERADNGYRRYDADSVARLRFIGRAKQLGCNLDEIADLVTAWNGGECGPVQDRLRALVADKLASAQTEIIELVALTADLQRAATSLEQHRPAGRCDDSCGCVSRTDTSDDARHVATAIALIPRPSDRTSSGSVPIACTLPTDQVADRLDDWNTLLSGATRTAIEGGVRIELDDHIAVADIARLAAVEQDCCRFFAFQLTIDQRGTALDVTAPPDAIDVVHAAFGAPQ